jgi:hypothetical protein
MLVAAATQVLGVIRGRDGAPHQFRLKDYLHPPRQPA